MLDFLSVNEELDIGAEKPADEDPDEKGNVLESDPARSQNPKTEEAPDKNNEFEKHRKVLNFFK